MPSVARSSPGTTHHNAFVLHKVKVFFQLFPGLQGSDSDRGIANVDYTYRVGGRVVSRGQTAADGSATVYLMPGAGLAELEVLGSRYQLRMGRQWEATTVEGKQRRLQMLGYLTSDLTNSVDVPMGLAAINFQSDHPPRDPNGTLDSDTESKLSTDAQE